MEWRIAWITGGPAAEMAAMELKRYLPLIDPDAAAAILKVESYDAALTGVLWVGMDAAFKDAVPGVEDAQLDDAVAIRVEGRAGFITGSNDRSVLLAAYRFLNHAGIRWIRPGLDGERICRRSLEDFSMELYDKAKSRHRGVCIEGANSYDHVNDLIDWLPKAGMNAYFFQFMVPFMFFEQWYTHAKNKHFTPQPITIAQAEAMTCALSDQIKRRGMMLHAVGHGWNALPFGLEGNSWNVLQDEVDEETVPYLAMINGKRGVHNRRTVFTNMCYSNPYVRERMVRFIVDYAKRRPDVDYLHVWLADNGNNNCECEACQGARPSDFYVMLLNEIDELMTAEGVGTRLVFLLYVDLLWPPEKERFINTQRFTLMFAPIFRTYSKTFLDTGEEKEVPPYVRNNLQFPTDIAGNLAHLKAWRKVFDGDGFDYDYHIIGDFNLDPGGFATARVLFEDMANLSDIRLNGMVGCQVQRAFFPAGLHMAAQAAGLWGGTTFEDFAKSHMRDVFGPDACTVREYLEKLSVHFDPPYLRGEKPEINPDAARGFAAIPGIVEAIEPLFEERLGQAETPTDRTTWLYMRCHARLSRMVAEALYHRASGDTEKAAGFWRAACEYLLSAEKDVHRAFDVDRFIDTTGSRFTQE